MIPYLPYINTIYVTKYVEKIKLKNVPKKSKVNHERISWLLIGDPTNEPFNTL